ncbi:MAG TPA: antitoxin VapB family protein [Thermoplasmata archaeon]|nr:antitoxin VapB family protein [Thermoplasmata archaeon]
MSSRNVAVRKDVYVALQRQKRPTESFTGLFLRLLHERTSIELALGAWGRFDHRRALRTLRGLRGETPGPRR